jgi:hypothetical protein
MHHRECLGTHVLHMTEGDSTANTDNESLFWTIAKYFLHGFLFSLILTGLMLVGVFILFILIAIGSFIGLGIGIALFIFFMGILNTGLTNAIWGYSCEWQIVPLLAHGLVLSFVLIIASLPFIALSFIAPGILTTIFSFIAGCFIDGYVCKAVADDWNESDRRTREVAEVVRLVIWQPVKNHGTSSIFGNRLSSNSKQSNNLRISWPRFFSKERGYSEPAGN